jgi:hypothetical protein
MIGGDSETDEIIDFAKLSTALSKYGSTLETLCVYEMRWKLCL